MRGQVGNWGDRLDVGFTPEMLAWLDQFGVDRHVSLSIMAVEIQHEDGLMRRTRSVTLTPDLKGLKVFYAGPQMGLEHHVRYRNEAFPDLELLQAPRFCLHEVTFFPGEEGLTAVIDHDHLLPWPRLSDCALYDVPEVLQRDLATRLRSAILHKSKTMGAPMPDRLRDRMAPGTYKAALAEARAALEAEKAAEMERKLAA